MDAAPTQSDKVHGKGVSHMISYKCTPSLRWRFNRSAFLDYTGHWSLRNINSQFQEFAMNSWRLPTRDLRRPYLWWAFEIQGQPEVFQELFCGIWISKTAWNLAYANVLQFPAERWSENLSSPSINGKRSPKKHGLSYGFLDAEQLVS